MTSIKVLGTVGPWADPKNEIRNQLTIASISLPNQCFHSQRTLEGDWKQESNIHLRGSRFSPRLITCGRERVAIIDCKVVSSKLVLQKGRPNDRHKRIAEYLVGDETETISFTARNNQDRYLEWRRRRWRYAYKLSVGLIGMEIHLHN